MIWFLSGIGNVPTPLSGIERSMLLACRLKDHFQVESEAHNFLFVITTTPSFLSLDSHFFSGQSWHASSSSIVLYLWLGAERPTAVPVKLGCLRALIRSDIVKILACLGLDHTWILIAYLPDHAEISTLTKDYYNSVQSSSRWADWSLECG